MEKILIFKTYEAACIPSLLKQVLIGPRLKYVPKYYDQDSLKITGKNCMFLGGNFRKVFSYLLMFFEKIEQKNMAVISGCL